MRKWLAPAEVNRLSREPGRQMQAIDVTGVDLTRPFLPESYTQLYYAPVYRRLRDEHRLRYNQLFGVRTNEYIMMLEADLVERLLKPLRRHPRVASDADLVQAIGVMIEEERRHYRIFLDLNRACLPGLFTGGRERFFSELPWRTRSLFGFIGLTARYLSFPLWYLMAMEEASMAMARDMVREPETETLGPLDPTFVAVHREHMKDEARHLHVDAHLIESCLLRDGDVRRWANTRLFTTMLGSIRQPERTGSGAKVIYQLVREFPDLVPLRDELVEAVTGLGDNPDYQFSLFNRRAMPLTFELFDAAPGFANLGDVMVGYERH